MPPQTSNTKTDPAHSGEESPARRLGILYLASLSAVALLLALGQVYILKDLSWRNQALQSITQLAEHPAFDQSLSQAALSILATDDPSLSRAGIERLTKLIAQDSREQNGKSQPPPGQDIGGQRQTGSVPRSGVGGPHRSRAIAAAESLLADLREKGATSAPTAGRITLVRTIVSEESALRRAITEAMLALEKEGTSHIDWLQSFEFTLFVLVMGVLLLEGIFVISPAVRKIQTFMNDLHKSNAEMRSYAARLERSNKELQDFASVASHDLQEPLRKVQAFGDRLKLKCAAALDDQGRDYLERIQNAAKRMQILINDLLTFSRVTTKAQPFTNTDLNEAVSDVLGDLEVRLEQVQGRVEVDKLPKVDADPLQMRQLMQNLIGNALKYHRADVPPIVKVHSKPANGSSNGMCHIMIDDNGIGFEEIYADRIFTIFQRLHGRNEYEGTGVGLAVCRKIVERHGGAITARSTPGQGSSFTVTLPVRQEKERGNDGAES
jgi:signal transduction histidine kinase